MKLLETTTIPLAEIQALSDGEMAKNPLKDAPAASSSSPTDIFMIFLVIGVLVSFLIFGYSQEALMRGKFGAHHEKFTFTTFLVLLQSIGNAVIAAVLLAYQAHAAGKKLSLSGKCPPKEWAGVALVYCAAANLGLIALQYIIFPLQVVCKSCKAIPVMIGEMVIVKKKIPLSKQLTVVLMSAGVACFTLFGESKKGGVEMGVDIRMLIGLALCFGALVCDGIYGPYQEQIQKTYPEVSAYHLMFNMNLYQGIISMGICVFYDSSIVKGVAFILTNPDVIPAIIQFTVTMALGQLFLFQLQSNYGALTVTLTTTVRKLISVVLSVIMFGHSITLIQWVSVGAVFFAQNIAQILVNLVKPRSLEPSVENELERAV